MLTDPPIYLPWLLAAVFIALLIWAIFWPSEEEEVEPSTNSTTGNQSSIFNMTHTGTGPNIAANTINFGPQLLQMTDEVMNQIANSLDPEKPVAISYANYGRTVALKETLSKYLVGRGFKVGDGMKGGKGYQPQPDKPLEIWPDGIKIGGMTLLGGQQIVRLDGDIPMEKTGAANISRPRSFDEGDLGMSVILEEAENLKLERVATIQTKRGEEYLINIDRAMCALCDLLSDMDNENRQGWVLNAAWYSAAIERLRAYAIEGRIA